MKDRLSLSVTLSPGGEGIWRVRSSPMHAVIDLLGDPYALRILRQIATGEQRFDKLIDALDLPRSTLSSRLKWLVTDKILTSKYGLTTRGQDVIGAVLMLDHWNAQYGVGPKETMVAVHSCGSPLEIALGCSTCDADVNLRTTRVLDLPGFNVRPRKLPAYRRRRHDEVKTLSAQHCFGDRWVALVLGAMFFGIKRFSDFTEALDIAPNVLSSRLQLLEQNRIIERHHTDYVLSPKGRDLFPLVLALLSWGERWLKPNWEKSAGYGQLHRPCGDWLRAQTRCASCNAPFSLHDVRWIPSAARRAS